MTLIFRILIVSVAITMTSFSARETFSITIEVKELRNSDGRLQFALYNREGSIPDEHYKKYFRLSTTDIRNNKAQVTFDELPAGKYAVNILHDENNNGKIDKGFILPKEGIGFSNYESIGLRHKPSFEKASFILEADTSIMVKAIYL